MDPIVHRFRNVASIGKAWKLWKKVVTGLLGSAPELTTRAGVRYVVPPRSDKQGLNAYVLVPLAKVDTYMFPFKVGGRYFTYVADSSETNDTMIQEVLGRVLPPESLAGRAGNVVPHGSTLLVKQEMTMLLAVRPERLHALRELVVKKSDAGVQSTVANAMRSARTARRSIIRVCGLPVDDFVPAERLRSYWRLATAAVMNGRLGSRSIVNMLSLDVLEQIGTHLQECTDFSGRDLSVSGRTLARFEQQGWDWAATSVLRLAAGGFSRGDTSSGSSKRREGAALAGEASAKRGKH
jgi:hypothetical protein